MVEVLNSERRIGMFECAKLFGRYGNLISDARNAKALGQWKRKSGWKYSLKRECPITIESSYKEKVIRRWIVEVYTIKLQLILEFIKPEVPPGDVVFVLQTRSHDSFERSGNDLLTTVKITLSEALLGFSRILVTHMDGRGIRVSSPPGKIIRPKDTIILRGEGMPVFKQPDEKGDMFVVLDVEMPTEQWLRTVDTEVRVQSSDSLRRAD